MATAKKDLEIQLVSLSLGVEPFNGDARREATFTLVAPRLAIAQKVSTQTLGLKKGEWRSEGQPWARRILFKESVLGCTAIEVEVTAPLSDADLDAASRTSASAAVKLLGGLAADAVPGGKVVSALSEIPVSALARLVSGSTQKTVEATGVADIPEALYGRLAVGGTMLVEVPLVARHDIYKTVRRSDKSGTASHRKTLVAEGAPVGRAVLSIKAL